MFSFSPLLHSSTQKGAEKLSHSVKIYQKPFCTFDGDIHTIFIQIKQKSEVATLPYLQGNWAFILLRCQLVWHSYTRRAESLTATRNVMLGFASPRSTSWRWLWQPQSRGAPATHWLNRVHSTNPSERGAGARHSILRRQQAESKSYKDLQLSEYCWFIDKARIKLYNISTIHSPSTPVAGCSKGMAIGDRNWRSSAKLSGQHWIRNLQ